MSPVTIPAVDESTLIDHLNDPRLTLQRWASAAACADLPHNPYIPEDDEAEPPASALRLCEACPVALKCLAVAMIHEGRDDFRFGWWGGVGPAERAELAVRLDIKPTAHPLDVDLLPPAERALRLRMKNRTIQAIALELGCTTRTVYRYLASAAA